MPRLGRTATGALVVTLLLGVLMSARRAPVPTGRVLEVELQASAGTFAQIFWDDGSGFSEARSSRATLVHTPRQYQVARLALPDGEVRALRFDPSDAPADILIRRMAVRDASGKQTAELNPGSLLPLNHVASMIREGPVTRIATPPAGSDPAFLVTVACLSGRSAWYDLSSVTPLSLFLAALLAVVATGVAVWMVARELRTPSTGHDDGVRAWRGAVWMVALFGLTVSTKLYLLHQFPSPVPWLDQWGAEAGNLYVPFSDGCLSWRQMFSLHNEHRIFFTRLMSLALLAVNSEWDPELQQVANAILHAVTALLVAAMLYLTNGRRRLDLVVVGCALVFAVPFAWENVIFAFQSAFYLLLLFTILALWLVLRFPTGTLPWALGWMCALSSMFTSAGGIATVAVMALATVSKSLIRRQSSSHFLANLLPSAVLLAIGIWTMSPPVPSSAALRAATGEDLIVALGRNLAWPWVNQPAFVLLPWAPLLALVGIRLWHRQSEDGSREWWIYALGLWVIVNAGLIAYGRGAHGVAPSSRYMDFLSLSAIVNLGAVFALVRLLPRPGVKRLVAQVGIAIWATLLVVGIDQVTQQGFVELAGVRTWSSQWTQNLRRFVVTDDLATLASKQFPLEVPFPDPVLLANAWLRHPYIRQILPPEIRAPLGLAAARITNEGFARNGFYPTTPADALRPAWGSFTARQNPSQGTFESTFITECSKRFLRFDVAGYLTTPGLSLAVQDFGSTQEAPIEPDELPRETWLSAFARCRAPFRVIGTDANAEFWFAFRDPIEYGGGSWIANRLVDHSRDLLLAFAALMLVACLSPWRDNRP